MITVKPPRRNTSITYFAARTGQFVVRGTEYSPLLAVHEMNAAGDGPRCATYADEFGGEPVDFIGHGPGLVDCWHCARNRQAQS